MKVRNKTAKLWLLCACLLLSACSSLPKPPIGPTSESEPADRPGQEQTVLRIGYSDSAASLHPLYARSEVEWDIASLTQEMLFCTDRNGICVTEGIQGERREYNGTPYEYSGLADVDIGYDKRSDTTVYHIALREDVQFADGEPLTADDLIFTLYVLLDPSYEGTYMLSRSPIVGMKNYRLDAPADVTVEEAEIKEVLEGMPPVLEERINRAIVVPVLEEELEWCASLFDSTDYGLLTEQFTSPEELFLHFYGREEHYELTGQEDVAELAAADYGGDYWRLGMLCREDGNAFAEDARQLAEEYIIEEKIASGQSGKAPNISGIRKIDDHRVDIYTNGYDDDFIYELMIPVLPLHYYGDSELYHYSENQFGFTKGDLSGILTEEKAPMGAGAYCLQKQEEDRLLLAANPHYYKDAPQIEQLHFEQVQDFMKLELLADGELDLVSVEDSKENVDWIRQQNGNDAISGSAVYTSLSDALRYSYIGINSETVNVGGKGDSEASAALRRALATVLSFYREEAVTDYSGSSAGVLDYPISRAYRIAPGSMEEGYEIAYSSDVGGADLYRKDMTAEERQEAMEQAVSEYLKTAGYTFRKGKVTRAPAGASLKYSVCIAGEEPGMKLCMQVLEQAQAQLKKIGMTLEIKDVKNYSALEQHCKGDYQLWCGQEEDMRYPDLYNSFGSRELTGSAEGNLFGLADRAIDAQLTVLRKETGYEAKKPEYYECLELILDQAVIVPVYQYRNCICFSAKTVDIESIAEDLTSFEPWREEICSLRMKQKDNK